MENILLKQIVSMLIIGCMLTPLNGVIADESEQPLDLTINIVGCSPENPYEDLPVKIKTDILNRGNTSIENVSIQIYLDNESTLLYSNCITVLESNESYRVSLEWNATLGNHTIFSVVDPQDSINESDESNNEDQINISVGIRESFSRSNGKSTWREAESWNYSYDTNSGEYWSFIDDTNAADASNENFTRQQSIYYDEDYAEWDFTVHEDGTYYFWIRGYYQDNWPNTWDACSDVRLYWDAGSSQQIGSSQDWCTNWDDWKWTCFDTSGFSLSEGDGTLRIKGFENHYIRVDNILITQLSPSQYTPTGTGVEGCENYTIGNIPPTLTPPGGDYDDCMDPDSGQSDDTFRFRIKYEDANGDVPSVKKIHYENDGSWHTESMNFQSGTPIGAVPYWAVYEFSTDTLSVGGSSDHEFYFECNDGEETVTSQVYDGPIVNPPVNDPPQLKYGGVNPDSGYTTDTFTFHVWYKDNESNAPEKKEVHYRDDSVWHTGVMSSTGQVNTDGFERYECDASGFSECSSNVFYFLFNDDISNHDDTRFPESGYCNGPVVSEENLPEISISDCVIDDDYDGESFGSDNGLVEGGEIIELEVTLENTGNDDAQNVIADLSLSESDPGITIVNDSVDVGTIPSSGSATGVFLFEVDVSHADESDVEFILDITDDDSNSWDDSIYLDIYDCPGLNYQYIRDNTEWLSYVFNYSYLPGEIIKGRAFGSKGEQFAARQIEIEMNKLDIFDNITRHQLDGSMSKKLEILDFGLQIDGGTGYESVEECYISPRWVLGDKTGNFSETDLTLKHRPSFPEFNWFIENNTDNIDSFMENDTSDNITLLEEYTLELFEEYYNFNFEELNESCETWPSYMECEVFPRSGEFLYIDEDPWNNPDESFGSEVLDDLNVDPFSDTYIYFKFFKLKAQLKLWKAIRWNCKGLILYDFNDHTHNMVNLKHVSLPVIFINGSLGEPMYTNNASYSVSYFIDQRWNTSVESYNVIGQINGSDTNKTVILSCLYDSWWNQGTADSAIGMSIVLGIAEYFDRHAITPTCNLQFVAFSGEEYGYIGAIDYFRKVNLRSLPGELAIKNLSYVLDLNQLGFTEPSDQRLTFNVITNKLCNVSQIEDIAQRTDYTNRTNDLADFSMHQVIGGGPSNNHPFAIRSQVPGGISPVKTVLFLKDTGWTMHHRDGRKNGVNLPHSAGDVFEYYDPLDVHVTGELILNVTLNLTVENTPNVSPSARNDSYVTSGNLTVSSPGVLANDDDAEDSSLSAYLVSDVNNGTLSLNENGGFSYTADMGFNGTDSFRYKAFDGMDYSQVAMVTITVADGLEVLDVNQSSVSYGFPIRDASDGAWGGAQNFTPTVSTITRVELYLRVFGTPEFNLTAELRVDNPEGTLMDSVVIPPEDVSFSWEWFSIDFQDVSVTPNVKYCIVLQPPGNQNTSFGYEWGYWSQGDIYDGGAFFFTRDGGGLWQDLPTMYDFTFRTYGLT